MKNWADRWNVTFEPSKCNAVTKRTPTKLDLVFGYIKLAENRSWKSLVSQLTASCHISNISLRPEKWLGALRRVVNKLDNTGRATVYKVQVRSVMEYMHHYPGWVPVRILLDYSTQFRGKPCVSSVPRTGRKQLPSWTSHPSAKDVRLHQQLQDAH